jgi:hypothetical protein
MVALVCYEKRLLPYLCLCLCTSVFLQGKILSPEGVYVKFVLGVLMLSVKKIKVWLISEKKKDHLTWEPQQIYGNISLSSS